MSAFCLQLCKTHELRQDRLKTLMRFYLNLSDVDNQFVSKITYKLIGFGH